MLRTFLGSFSTLLRTGNTVGSTTSFTSTITSKDQINPAIEKILASAPPEIQKSTQDALQKILSAVVGETLQHSNRQSPITYKVNEWQTETQKGRNKVQVPGFLTVRVGGDSAKKKPPVGVDDYYFIFLKELGTLKVVRIMPSGEQYYSTKHFDELWKNVLRTCSVRRNEQLSDYAKNLGITIPNEDTISVITFDERDY
jgi:hypothetical protein